MRERAGVLVAAGREKDSELNWRTSSAVSRLVSASSSVMESGGEQVSKTRRSSAKGQIRTVSVRMRCLELSSQGIKMGSLRRPRRRVFPITRRSLR